MKLVISKHIHASFSCVGSGDVWLHRIIDNVERSDIPKHIPQGYDEENVIEDDVAGIITVYVEADKTFYNKGLKAKGMPVFAGTPEFIALVEQYKKEGWVEEPEDIKAAREAKYKRDEASEAVRRAKDGYVFPDYERDDYSGGFSEELLNEPELAKYIASGCVFGYIGHYGRRFEVDTFFEEAFMALKTPPGRFNKRKLFATWLTSTDGRHFGDSLEDISLDEAKAKIKARLPEIFNLAFIYSRKEHQGTWESTQALRKKYAKKLLKEKEA